MQQQKTTDVTDEVVDARRKVYGEPAETFPRAAQIWSGILGHEVNASDVALCLIGFKALRAAMAPDYSDNSDDIEGYLAIFREIVGDDMVAARSIAEYVEGVKARDQQKYPVHVEHVGEGPGCPICGSTIRSLRKWTNPGLNGGPCVNEWHWS